MSVSLRTLSAATYAQGVTMWTYVTNDSRREIEGSTYWANAAVNPGDWLFVTHQPYQGNTIYAFVREPNGALRARRMCSTFAED